KRMADVAQKTIFITVDQKILLRKVASLFLLPIKFRIVDFIGQTLVQFSGTGKWICLALGAIEKAGAPRCLAQNPVDNGMIATARHTNDAQFLAINILAVTRLPVNMLIID